MQYISKSPQQTMALGQKIAKTLHGGEVLALSGNLGAGKTTFIKGLALGLKIKKIITSPTFVLMKVYQVTNRQSPIANHSKKSAKSYKLKAISYKPIIKQLIHLDCYRLKDAQDIIEIGANDYFGKKDTITVIEWPEKIKPILSGQIIKIVLKLANNNQRKITIKI